MNTACKTLASAAVLCLLSACATSQSLATVQPGRSIVQDSDYIAKVEDDAAHSPVRVHVIWVRPPERKLEE